MEIEIPQVRLVILFSLLAAGILVGMVLLVTHNKNDLAGKAIDNYDLFLRGYNIVQLLTDDQGLPINWDKVENPSVLGLLTDYEVDEGKVDRLFSMGHDEFSRFYNLTGLDYKFELITNSTIIKDQNKTISNNSIRVVRRLDDDRDIVFYLWEINVPN